MVCEVEPLPIDSVNEHFSLFLILAEQLVPDRGSLVRTAAQGLTRHILPSALGSIHYDFLGAGIVWSDDRSGYLTSLIILVRALDRTIASVLLIYRDSRLIFQTFLALNFESRR